MLKGAIDHVSPSEIGGWVYCSAGSLRDHTVLAFVDDVCIGAGRVELFREDLAHAGLGDGFLGFRFPVHLAKADEAPLVAVKLEGSDAVIMQSSARLTRRASLVAPTCLTARTLASVEWMRGRGWLEQLEYDFLRLMLRFGVYDFSLRKAKAEEKRSGIGLRDPLDAVQEMFDLLCTAPSKVAVEVIGADSQLESVLGQVRESAIEPIVALWSPQRGAILLVEGSHQDSLTGGEPEGAVEYLVGPDRLLFFDLRCRFKTELSSQAKCYSMSVA